MSRALKTVLAVPALVVLALVAGVIVLQVTFPKAGAAPELTVPTTPERIERGRYLAQHVSMCIDCHSERDWSQFAGPLKAGSEGMGGERFARDMGLPGEFYASNLTPARLGAWTDGEILHAFTTGVARDGRAMFPIMPYPLFARMARGDAEAIVAYLRTLAPLENDVPERDIDFPMNLITRTIPAAANLPAAAPDPRDELAYGEYMITIAACGECHTMKDHGEPVAGMAYAGGMVFPLPTGGSVRSANITPDAVSGIGGWTREQFIARFKAWERAREPVAPGNFNTIMPWTQYAGMTERDLGAIYTYLRTVPAVTHSVVRFTPGE